MNDDTTDNVDDTTDNVAVGRDGGPGLADDLLALGAHELRGPVAAIVGYAETVRDRRHLLSDQQLDEALDTIVRQAGRLEGLLQDILVLAAGNAGLLELHPRAVPLRQAVEDVLVDGGIDPATVEVACDAAVAVVVDPRRLHQMLANYVANAALHGRPPLAVEVDVDRGAGAVRVAVRDGGDGVAPDRAGELFGRFQRAGAAASTPGSGLGLAVVRTLAQASGGAASYVQGPPGRHAFVLVLPLAAGEEPPAARAH